MVGDHSSRKGQKNRWDKNNSKTQKPKGEKQRKYFEIQSIFSVNYELCWVIYLYWKFAINQSKKKVGAFWPI